MTPRLTAAQKVEARLRSDTPYWAQAVAKIINEQGEAVPFRYRNAQLKLERVLADQHARGLPMRAIVLKSRRRGISSSGMAKLTHRCTTIPNRRAYLVAQDNGTSEELFGLAQDIYYQLPEPPDAPDWLKPRLISDRNAVGTQQLRWGNPSKAERQRGDLGINSWLRVDNAKEADAGRGKTITDLWLTEVAAWQDPLKSVSLLNAVFDVPETMIVIESTANGHNAFKARWDSAVRGDSAFVPIFVGWTDDENCQRPFSDPDERAEFVQTIGKGDYGADELMLIERFGCTPEQLHWRRITIADKCDGKIEIFKQEFPSVPTEAFIASGNHVFSMVFVQKVLDRTDATDKTAAVGILKEKAVKTRRLMNGEIEVPTGTLWVPREATGFSMGHDFWRVWEPPRTAENGARAGQYVVGVDVADGDTATSGDRAYHAIEVIDHITGDQCAEYRSRVDTDLLTLQACLIGLYYNEAWIAVEVTGSHGLPVARDLQDKYGYRRLYRRRRHDSSKEKTGDLRGWDTNRRTKPLLIAELTALLREGTDGIRSKLLALEFTTYVQLPSGKSGPDDEAFADLLMAYGIAQQVRTEIPPQRTFELPPAHDIRRVPRRPTL